MGSAGLQSLISLQTLLALGIKPQALALAAPQQPAPSTASLGGIGLVREQPQSAAAALAERHGIPQLRMSAEGDCCDLAGMAPQLILVSCYPYRLPQELLALPPLGCFNIHPSLLPHYRGPSPIFWQLRDGLTSLGVSVHHMTPQLDKGPLLAQVRPPPQPVQSYAAWVERLSAAGVESFVRRLDALHQGCAALTPQTAGGNYRPWPKPADFEIDRHWGAGRIAYFVAGTGELGRHFIRLADGSLFVIERLLDYSPGQGPEQAIALSGDRLVLDYPDGRLELAGARLDDGAGWPGEDR